MRIAFMGTPDFSVPPLVALHQAGHEIAAVYTQPPRPAGRGKKERPSAVHLRAEELGLDVRHPVTLRDATEQGKFADLHLDAAVVVAYGLILPAPVLAAPTHGCLNIHASLLPRWRGAAPIHRAIMSGDMETGISIMSMELGLDTGPVLLTERTEIGETETTGELHDRLSEMGAELIVKALEDLSSFHPEPQPDDGVTYAAKIDKSEAKIDWSRDAIAIDRQIRALSPFPGAWCMVGEERVKILRSKLVDGQGDPGTHFGDFRIACGSGAVEVLEAQRQGKRPMKADEILRGLSLPDVLT